MAATNRTSDPKMSHLGHVDDGRSVNCRAGVVTSRQPPCRVAFGHRIARGERTRARRQLTLRATRGRRYTHLRRQRRRDRRRPLPHRGLNSVRRAEPAGSFERVGREHRFDGGERPFVRRGGEGVTPCAARGSSARVPPREDDDRVVRVTDLEDEPVVPPAEPCAPRWRPRPVSCRSASRYSTAASSCSAARAVQRTFTGRGR